MDFELAHRLINDCFGAGQELHFNKHAQIIPIGVGYDYIYLITEGIVNVYSYRDNGSAITHFLYKSGELFPISGLIDRRIPGVGISAAGPVTVKRKRVDEFKKILNERPEAYAAIMAQQNLTYDRIITLNMEPADARLVQCMCVMAARLGVRKDDHIVMDLPLTIQELADSARLSRESTGKILGRLESQEAIILGKQRIIIYPDNLARLYDSELVNSYLDRCVKVS